MEPDYEPIRSEESNPSENDQSRKPSQEGEQDAPVEEPSCASSAPEQAEEAECDSPAVEKTEDSAHAQPSGQLQDSHHNIDLGKRGEKAAAAFLERRGMEILERNWRCPAGEVDIVARDENDSLRFVEVKTRSNCDKGFPAEAVDAARRARYERIAAQYLKTYEITDIAVCFDIISIIVTGENRAFLRLHRNAFSCNDC